MKKLPLMLIAAAMLVGLAALMSHRERTRGRPAPELGQRLVPGFASVLAGGSIQTIAISRGETTSTLELGENGWTVREQFGYPADFARLQRLLPTLGEVKIGQVLAAGAALDPAETTIVQWLDASGKVIGGVRLGQTRQAPAREDQPYGAPAGGRFVSREGDAKVYLVGDALTEFDADPKSWVDKQLLSVAATDVETVRIEHADGETVELAKNGGDLTLLGLADSEEFDASKRYGVGGALSYLRFSDVADPALADDVTGLATATVYRATTSRGQSFEARIGASPDGSTERYARFAVTLAPAVPEEVAEEEDEAAKAAREARASERAALEQSTAELNAKLSGWTFLVGSYNADNMTLRRAALVKEKVAETSPAEDAAAAQDAPDSEAAAEPAAAAEEESAVAEPDTAAEEAPAVAEAPAVENVPAEE